jgi:hypothetical protein
MDRAEEAAKSVMRMLLVIPSIAPGKFPKDMEEQHHCSTRQAYIDCLNALKHKGCIEDYNLGTGVITPKKRGGNNGPDD